MGNPTKDFETSLHIADPVIPILHGLSKIHKSIHPLPMRPIVSGINSLNERLCEWLDTVLQPLVRKLPRHLQDNRDVLTSFEDFSWTEDSTWISYDVESLYTCIPHFVAIKALEHHFSVNHHLSEDLKGFVIDVTLYLMTHNFFHFNDRYNLQLKGVSMGAKFSPSLANLVMAWWEEIYIYNDNNPFVKGLGWYGRYIDDDLIVWQGNVSAIPALTQYLNCNPLNLKFVLSAQGDNIHFLDLCLTGTLLEGVRSTSFRKPTAGNAILHFNSFHPLKAIPVGELSRIRRNCSDQVDFSNEAAQTTDRLKNRGYPQLVLDRSHNSQFSQIKSIVERYIPMLSEYTTLDMILQEGFQVVSRRPQTLANILSPSMFSKRAKPPTWLSHKGFFRCGTHPCRACLYANPINNFQNSDSSRSYDVKQYTYCNSCCVVYCIFCNLCNVQYIGCTKGKLKIRILEHLKSITNPGTRMLSFAAQHFIEKHDSHTNSFKFFAIEKVSMSPRGGDLQHKLRDREAFWILSLGSMFPRGLNSRKEFMFHY